LREDDLLPDAQGIVTPPVEGLLRYPPEVSHPGKYHVHQFIQEEIHPLPAQGHHAADGHPLPQLEGRDGFLGPGHHRFLSGDGGEFSAGRLQQLDVLDRLSQPQIDDDLLHPGRLHGAAVAKLLHHAWHTLGPVIIPQPGLELFGLGSLFNLRRRRRLGLALAFGLGRGLGLALPRSLRLGLRFLLLFSHQSIPYISDRPAPFYLRRFGPGRSEWLWRIWGKRASPWRRGSAPLFRQCPPARWWGWGGC